MKFKKINTRVTHSMSKNAWNIVGTILGGKFKIARIPYVLTDDKEANEILKNEAKAHADFISYCLNNSDKIIKNMQNEKPI